MPVNQERGLDLRAANSKPTSGELPRGTHRVVILGGGFGGLLAAKALRLAPVQVTLVDKRNFHLFQSLLCQVATGSLAPGQVAAPLRGIHRHQKNASVLLGEAVDVDPAGGSVLLADGDRIEYDSLIVATCSQSSYSGKDEWRQWAPSLKSMEEATTIRHKILYAFEAAERAKTPDERRAWLTFTIVGGGATALNWPVLSPTSRHAPSATSSAPSGLNRHRSSSSTDLHVCSPAILNDRLSKRNGL